MVICHGEICKTFEVDLFTALLACRPGKGVVDDGVDAGGLVVPICDPSCTCWTESTARLALGLRSV